VTEHWPPPAPYPRIELAPGGYVTRYVMDDGNICAAHDDFASFPAGLNPLEIATRIVRRFGANQQKGQK
jgi:hypothetical protein